VIGHGFWGGPGWGILGFLLMVAFWTLVVIIIVGLVRGRGPGGGTTASGTGALRILEERYARGEMSRDEFLERRAVLTGQRREPGDPTEPNPPAAPPA
jgi:putative membrane protein